MRINMVICLIYGNYQNTKPHQAINNPNELNILHLFVALEASMELLNWVYNKSWCFNLSSYHIALFPVKHYWGICGSVLSCLSNIIPIYCAALYIYCNITFNTKKI